MVSLPLAGMLFLHAHFCLLVFKQAGCAILWLAVLSALCCAVLCCAVLCCAVPCSAVIVAARANAVAEAVTVYICC